MKGRKVLAAPSVEVPPARDTVRNYERRISQLRDMAQEEDITVNSNSFEDFGRFVRRHRTFPQAGLILTDEGDLVAIWKNTAGDVVEVEFLGDGVGRLIVFRKLPRPLDTEPEIERKALDVISQKIGEWSFIRQGK